MVNIISKLRARKVLYLIPTAIVAVCITPLHWLLIGTMIYFIFFRWYTLIYHEYQAHKFIKPKNQIIESIGYFIMALYEWHSPENKIKFHELHHDHYRSQIADPTEAKLSLANNCILYCLDLTPHANIPNIDIPPIAIETTSYKWFNKHWAATVGIAAIGWLIVFPVWTFFAFYCFPMFFWSIIYRTTDWTCHKTNLPDRNWACLYLGTSAWHGRHHDDPGYNRTTYYGLGIWKYLNIDFWITMLLFDDM